MSPGPGFENRHYFGTHEQAPILENTDSEGLHHASPYRHTPRRVDDAGNIVAGQLQRAGVRLARLLNDALR
jgi:hypothetical protein